MSAAKRSSQAGVDGFGEFEAIALLRETLSTAHTLADQPGKGRPEGRADARDISHRGPNPWVKLGIGDDAAVIQAGATELVWSTDASLEHVHFDLRYLSLELAAARAIHAAVSDLAAMGARPLGALVALELPPQTSKHAVAQIGRGQARATSALGCPIIGGNISRGSRFGFTTSVLGYTKAERACLRSRARVGDEIWLSHPVGWAALGLRLLQDGVVTLGERGGLRWHQASEPEGARRAVLAWQRPHAKVAEALRWARRCNALIDISDGLTSEAQHLAIASQCQLVLNKAALWQAHDELIRAAHACRVPVEPLILAGGEDYALLATGPRTKRPADALAIGRVEAGAAGVLLQSDGACLRVTSTGHDHLNPGTRRSPA